MDETSYRARHRTHDEIRRGGAVTSLTDGIEITTHGVHARLIAWPGNGFQTESVHVLTLRPGDTSEIYGYAMAEEAVLCLKGKGQVFLRGRWADVEAGDLAYFPEGTSHALRNPEGNRDDLVLVAAMSPPPFDLYEAGGYYDRRHRVMDHDAIEAMKRRVGLGRLDPGLELHYNESDPELRAWNLPADDVRRRGALFNVCTGASFSGLDAPMRLVLWPAYGARMVGLHYGYGDPGQRTLVHTHPVSDELVMMLGGKGQFYCGDRWLDVGTYDCVMAPCGVRHGAAAASVAEDGRNFVAGFASPPQLDLYLDTEYYTDGKFSRPPFHRLES